MTNWIDSHQHVPGLQSVASANAPPCSSNNRAGEYSLCPNPNGVPGNETAMTSDLATALTSSGGVVKVIHRGRAEFHAQPRAAQPLEFVHVNLETKVEFFCSRQDTLAIFTPFVRHILITGKVVYDRHSLGLAIQSA